MKNLKNSFFFLLVSSLCFFSSCTSSDDGPGNNNPTSFSSNTTETKTYGATIIWTESTDFDGEPVSYTIVLEGQEIASEINTLTYTFTNLEPETIYEGYIEARDGSGGATTADFFFTTEPILALEWRDFVEEDVHLAVAYFEVLEKSGASSYVVEVKDYSINTIPATVGRTYLWSPGDNLPTGNNVGSGGSGLTEFSSGVYHANTNVSSVGAGSDALAQMLSFYGSLSGTAELTVRYQ